MTHSDISDATVTAMLVKLKAYPLTKEMLVKTRVGRVVKKLASHRVSTVRDKLPPNLLRIFFVNSRTY